MSSHAIIVFIITVLSTFIQVDFQSKSLSPLETHYWITPTFFVVLLAYALTWGTTTNTIEVQVLNDQNDNKMIMRKISLFLGALASVLLMIIVFPVLGWVSFVLWALYCLKNALEFVNFALLEVIDKLSRVIHGQLYQTEEEDSLPV